MHYRIGCEDTEWRISKSQFHRNVRILRATIIRGKKMKQMEPARLSLPHVPAVLNHGHAESIDPVALMKKHARFLRMSAIREKRMTGNPPTEIGTGSSKQINFTISVDKVDSSTNEEVGEGRMTWNPPTDISTGSSKQINCTMSVHKVDSRTNKEVGEGRMTGNPPTEISTGSSKQINYTMSVHKVDSSTNEEVGEGRMTGNPPTEISSGSSKQINYTMSVDKVDSSTNEKVGEGAITSCEAGLEPISPEVTKGIYIGIEEDTVTQDESEIDKEDKDLDNIWTEMEFAMESCKDFSESHFFDEDEKEDEDDCHHSFILKDDIGYVCRVCGLVQKKIQDMFEFLYPKQIRTKSYYRNEPQKIDDDKHADTLPDWCKHLNMDLGVTEVLAHAKHMKQMKPHQIEGFNFLLRNLVTENPHGCILAHAPGSGKTFMMICFMHSYLTKYPSARPLIVLPKGILGTWKKEFQRWQLEDIPLYDFYSVKAANRSQQLNVLKQWAETKSVLFLGYKQFSAIVTGDTTNKEKAACKEILVRAPTVLILDEGHTPRNKETDTLHSLTQVQTPRKVVLSGTLYQNHVKEVFNILNLVQPRFLKLERNRVIVKRIMSKVEISGVRKQLTGAGDTAFYDLVESTLSNDTNEQRKVGIIKDLRDMTSHVLHYYKGDSFDELPGLTDFTVLLNLSPKQKVEVDEMKKLKERKFRCSSLGSAIYLHPELKQFSGNNSKDSNQESRVIISDEKIDRMIKKMNLKDGVKAKFFLNLISLCDIAKEKLLVFSQYLLPLKFLERLAVLDKGWTVNKEIFMITGESTTDQREWSMEQFNSSPNARVFFGSIKACGEGISLVGASRVLILDIHPNPSVSWQAVCRAFRPGQQKKVFTYRLVAADSPEEEDHSTCFRKEVIAKMWFEWDEFAKKKDMKLESVDLEDCCDIFLQNSLVRKDVKALYKR